jgi:hypothetical protein
MRQRPACIVRLKLNGSLGSVETQAALRVQSLAVLAIPDPRKSQDALPGTEFCGFADRKALATRWQPLAVIWPAFGCSLTALCRDDQINSWLVYEPNATTGAHRVRIRLDMNVKKLLRIAQGEIAGQQGKGDLLLVISKTRSSAAKLTQPLVSYARPSDGWQHGYLYSGGNYITLDNPLANPPWTFTNDINNSVQIPRQGGHRFRRKAATQSDGKRPPIPNEGGHPIDRVKRGRCRQSERGKVLRLRFEQREGPMPAERLSMRKVREALRLKYACKGVPSPSTATLSHLPASPPELTFSGSVILGKAFHCSRDGMMVATVRG